jgi:hypothetical protein
VGQLHVSMPARVHLAPRPSVGTMIPTLFVDHRPAAANDFLLQRARGDCRGRSLRVQANGLPPYFSDPCVVRAGVTRVYVRHPQEHRSKSNHYN